MKKLFLLLAVIFVAVVAQAQTVFHVTNTNDSGAGSLRQAILDANATTGNVKINFNFPSNAVTIYISDALPDVNSNINFLSSNALNSITINAVSPAAAQSDGLTSSNFPNPAYTLTAVYLNDMPTVTARISYQNFTPKTYVVSNNQGADVTGSFRNATKLACNRKVAVLNNVTFNIPGPAPHIIDIGSNYLSILEPIAIDGSTQPLNGGTVNNGVPKIQIKGSGSILTYSNTTFSVLTLSIAGICFTDFTDALVISSQANISNCYFYNNKTGIRWNNSNGGKIINNTFGVNPYGTSGVASNEKGIYVYNSHTTLDINNNTILNSTQCGLEVNSSTIVSILSNRIGVDPNIAQSLPNKVGVKLYSSSNIALGNISFPNRIIGNTESGIEITYGSSISVNGNTIGMGSIIYGYGPQQGYGVRVIFNAGVTISDNMIGQNNIGIQAASGVVILETNTINYNNIGISNGSLSTPKITSVSSTQIKGTAVPNSTVAIYESTVYGPGISKQGGRYLGKTTASSAGSWVLLGTYSTQAQCYITAYSYAWNSASSEFTQAYNFDFLPDSLIACEGSIITPTNTFANYLWADGSTNSSLSVTTPGKYWLDVNFCSKAYSDTVKLNFITAPTVNLGNDTTYCSYNGYTRILDATNQIPGVTYTWKRGAATVGISPTYTVSTSGTYSVEVKKDICSRMDTTVIEVYSPPFIPTRTVKNKCVNENYLYSKNAALGTYVWSDGSTGSSITISEPGKYWVTGTAASGCVATDTLIISDINLQPDLGSDTTVCSTQNFVLNGSNVIAGTVYSWLYNDIYNSGNGNSIMPTKTGKYKVTASNGFCTKSDSVNVTVIPFKTNLINDTIVCNTGAVTKTMNPQGTYLWSDGSQANTFTISETGQYWVDAKLGDVCSAKDTFYVRFLNCNEISGIVCNDMNANNIIDASDIRLKDIVMCATSGNVKYYTVTDNNGLYTFNLPNGTYTITCGVLASHIYKPSGKQYSVTVNQNIVPAMSYDFINRIYTKDLSVAVTSPGRVRPGTIFISSVQVKNTGTATVSANCTLEVDPMLTLVSSSLPYTLSNGKLTYNLGNINADEQVFISLQWEVPLNIELVGKTLNLTGEALLPGDLYLPNNISTSGVLITYSFDPNAISVQAQYNPATQQPYNTTRLLYKIEFQNTGTDYAEDIVIIDTLPTGVDPSTIKIAGASHAYTWSISEYGIIKFTFNDIMLLDSNANEPASHGYISYFIDHTASLPVGTVIENEAYIYFDINEPVKTNVAEYRITGPSSAQSISFAALPSTVYNDTPYIVLSATATSGLPISFAGAGPVRISNDTLYIVGTGEVLTGAYQAGNSQYNPAYPKFARFTVITRTQTLSLAALPDKIATDAPFSINATAGASGEPVVYSIVSGPATIVNNVITLTGAGTVVVKAEQNGNTYYSAATPVTQQFNVSLDVQTLSLSTLADLVATDAPFSINATAGASGEPVVYSIVSGPATIINNVITLTGAGTVVVKAEQNGNTYYSASTPVTQQFNVSLATQTIITAIIDNKNTDDLPFDVTFTGGGSGNSVAYTVVSGPATMNGNTITLTGQAGIVVIEATQSGNNLYAAAPAVQTSFEVLQVTNVVKGSSEVSVWPNPCSGVLNVSMPQSGNYELMNVQGKVVQSGICSQQDTLDLSSLPSGMYTLKIQNGEQVKTTTIMKQ